MSSMLEILKKIYPLKLAPVSDDRDKAIEILKEELPFKVHEYPSGTDYNGWVIPMNWKVNKATIHKNGKLIYDGQNHSLGVIGYSQSFQGSVTLEELKEHLFYHPVLPNAIVYHYMGYYRTWEKNWGFSMPHNLFNSLKSGTYDIELETVHEPGHLKVSEYLISGESDKTITFLAHDCHAGQANDNISGVVVGIEVMKRLKKQKNKYTYRLLVGPEQYESITFLGNQSKEELKKNKYGFYLEVLGHHNRFALQKTFNGDSEIDRAAIQYLTHKHPDHYCGEFRQVIGNDETVWEAPGYEIPTISFSRANTIAEGMPYPEYHSSMDTDDIIDEDCLEEAVEAVMGICQILETNCTMKRNFDGLIALSNPKYDLYFNCLDPSVRESQPETQRQWFYMMTCLFRYFDDKMTILEIAERHGLPYKELYDYICKFRDRGLIEFNKK